MCEVEFTMLQVTERVMTWMMHKAQVMVPTFAAHTHTRGLANAAGAPCARAIKKPARAG